MTRTPLFNRRANRSLKVEHFDPLAGPNGGPLRFHVTLGEFADGKPGEVFITAAGKSGKGSMLETVARDVAVLMSLAIQYGAPLETMRRAVSRDESNRPQTFVGAVLDAMEG